MALNLSTLTSSATSGDVLAEALTTADFLEPVPVLRNLARGSQKGGDAKQDVALNQPKALPYDGKGYLYLSGVSGNYADVPVFDIGALDDFTIQVDGLDAGSVRPSAIGTPISYFGDANVNRSFILQIGPTGKIVLYLYLNTDLVFTYNESTAVPTNTVGIRVTRVGTVLTYWVDTGSGYVSHDTDIVSTTPLHNPSSIVSVNIGQFSGGNRLLGKISRAIIWNNGTQAGTPVLDVDFTATNIRHGDTKFKCATGQVVTINQSGNDPATVIKKSVLRFDGVNDGLQGLFANNINSGYMFAAFSVLGDGGDDYGRIFGANINGGFDYQNTGFALRRLVSTETLNLRYSGGWGETHQNLFDDDRGDLLFESRLAPSSQKSKVNDADGNNGVTTLPDTGVAATEYSISSDSTGGSNLAIDLEYLALFPASITDAQADSVRNYINNRNNVFSLIDSQGYYFYNAQSAPVGAITTGSASWNGRIVGSDNGDSDRYATQGTTNDAPVSDGYVVTFADNTDHLDIPQVTQAGWQVVGTSLGTFAYRVDNDARTELNILGNRGHPNFRKTGDLYGIMLLPESATSADVNAARKLLIDRGAADGATASSLNTYWYDRTDIVEFDSTNMVNAINLSYAWYGCVSLSGLAAIQAPNGNNFSNAWQNCSALTSFPAGAKLGTEATNVNFSSAWRSSGLTSFSTPLPTATTILSAWRSSSITSFSADLPLAIDAREAWLGTPLTSFSTPLPLVTKADYSWFVCSSITNFSAPLPVVESVFQAWLSCTSLTDFSADVFANWNPSSITSGVFNLAWDGCSALSAQSVENILTSIDASGKYATTTGASGGSALADGGIDIDYNTGT